MKRFSKIKARAGIFLFAGGSAGSLINTPLQRGGRRSQEFGNRSHGFSHTDETVEIETVSSPLAPWGTPLKRGVNERGWWEHAFGHKFLKLALATTTLLCCPGCGETRQAKSPPPPVVEVAGVTQVDVPIYHEWIGVLVGLVTLLGLPVAQFPKVVPPEIFIQANYVGADAQTIEQSVATPIEQQMSGVDNMNYMYSINANNGLMRMFVNFDLKTDPNIGHVLTQLRYAQAESQLPADVRNYGVTVQLSSERYVAGKASYYEVLEAQQQLPSQLNLARTQRDQLLAVVTLYKTLGGGWRDEMNLSQQP